MPSDTQQEACRIASGKVVGQRTQVMSLCVTFRRGQHQEAYGGLSAPAERQERGRMDQVMGESGRGSTAEPLEFQDAIESVLGISWTVS